MGDLLEAAVELASNVRSAHEERPCLHALDVTHS
jgi:hypothetical protein